MSTQVVSPMSGRPIGCVRRPVDGPPYKTPVPVDYKKYSDWRQLGQRLRPVTLDGRYAPLTLKRYPLPDDHPLLAQVPWNKRHRLNRTPAQNLAVGVGNVVLALLIIVAFCSIVGIAFALLCGPGSGYGDVAQAVNKYDATH